MKEFEHIPVMLKECIDGLNIKKDGLYVDGTLGRSRTQFSNCKTVK